MIKLSRREFIVMTGAAGVAHHALSEATVQPGETLKPWQAGSLEIHHINTGLGESAFVIMPDGTTLMIDAGDASGMARPDGFMPPPRPDKSRPAGEWIGRYIRARHPAGSSGIIDYGLMTHFHPDHISGIKDLFAQVPIKLIQDRGWPEYDDYPKKYGEMMTSYRAFIDSYTAKGGSVEKFIAGRNDQIRMLNYPDRYNNFEIRNLAVNGKVWSGQNNITDIFEGKKSINENNLSAALLIKYGNFTYYNGGDILDPVEKGLLPVLDPLDIHVADHHGSEAGEEFLKKIKPRVHIVQVWDSIQPRPEVLDRMLSEKIYPGQRDIFLTNGIWPGRENHLLNGPYKYPEDIARKYLQSLSKLTSIQGHVVIKVAPDTASYQVMVLDDSNESFRIKSVSEYKSCGA